MRSFMGRDILSLKEFELLVRLFSSEFPKFSLVIKTYSTDKHRLSTKMYK